MELTFSFSGFQIIYSAIALFMWSSAALFSFEYMKKYKKKKRYYIFLFATFLATVCVFLAKDFYTLFLFFETMSFTSYVWVVFDEKKESLDAGNTYLAVAVIGGMTMLMGIFLLYHLCGTLDFWQLSNSAMGILKKGGEDARLLRIACYLLFVGFGAKAGAFPMHIWLPKAHPVAPAPASALLSGILTKTGIFGILLISCYLMVGQFSFFHFLMIVGTITMLLGGILGILSVNLKRTIACSSVSQIGFILVGIAMMGLLAEHNAHAARGTFLHMMNHSLFKLTLFMAAGVVYMNIHALDFNKIRGFGRKKPLLHFIFLCGAFGIAGIPGFSGYISKSLLHEAILEGVGEFPYLSIIEKLFLLAGGMTVCYMLKIYIALFIEKNQDASLQKKYDAIGSKYMNPLSKVTLTICALVIPVLGLSSHVTMDKLANHAMAFMKSGAIHETIPYFTLENLEGSVISISIGVLLYGLSRFILMKKTVDKRTKKTSQKPEKEYVNILPKVVDLEKSIYVPIIELLCLVLKIIARIMDGLVDGMVVILRKTIYRDSPLPHELEEGNLFTHILGMFLDTMESALNITIHKKHPTHMKFEHRLARSYELMRQTNDLIARTMSFGLIIFMAGLVFTILYLLKTVN